MMLPLVRLDEQSHSSSAPDAALSAHLAEVNLRNEEPARLGQNVDTKVQQNLSLESGCTAMKAGREYSKVFPMSIGPFTDGWHEYTSKHPFRLWL